MAADKWLPWSRNAIGSCLALWYTEGLQPAIRPNNGKHWRLGILRMVRGGLLTVFCIVSTIMKINRPRLGIQTRPSAARQPNLMPVLHNWLTNTQSNNKSEDRPSLAFGKKDRRQKDPL